MKKGIFLSCLFGALISNCYSLPNQSLKPLQPLVLQSQPGFFRLSIEEVKMPRHMNKMGLFGITYLADLSPHFYFGAGGYGSITGSEGGLFVLGIEGGLQYYFTPHWLFDSGIFIGGGGGHSSLVGGGLMLRPHAGIGFDWFGKRLGLNYSYINFPTGQIHSHQISLGLDLPVEIDYVCSHEIGKCFSLDNILIPKNRFLAMQKNDFLIFAAAYLQKPGTKNVSGNIQDGTIGLVGAELDHYMTDQLFWWVKASGALRGVPNGYMDVIGGLGYQQKLDCLNISLVPQLGVGAGGGGTIDTGGGVMIQPQIGLQIPITTLLAARLSGGYLWAPKGHLSAYTGMASLIYHLNLAKSCCYPTCCYIPFLNTYGWRIQLFNQTYIHPQRVYATLTSNVNMIALQFDQLISPNFYFSYQASSAYEGDHTGGYATGMIGPGFQTIPFLNQHAQLFGEILIGAGGGGSLALGGGSIIEPVLGAFYWVNPGFGLKASVSQIKALNHHLNTTVVNLGLSIKFGTLQSC